MFLLRLAVILIAFIFLCSCSNSQADASEKKLEHSSGSNKIILTTNNTYSWHSNYDIKDALINRIPVPEGFKRTTEKIGSFADWLRFLPLKPGNPDVCLYNGKLKNYQGGHYALVDIDVGKTDIQQCADAVMRMRAEYLYSIKEFELLHFNFTSGHSIGFKKWVEGYRTVIKDNNVSWSMTTSADNSYKTFKGYMNTIFNYAGTSSLSKELKKVSDISDIKIGDVFIVGGFPGHAVLVIDVCVNSVSGEKLFLIQQSYMPAQDIHILKNLNNAIQSPWYSVRFASDLETPEWTFSKDQLMRF